MYTPRKPKPFGPSVPGARSKPLPTRGDHRRNMTPGARKNLVKMVRAL